MSNDPAHLWGLSLLWPLFMAVVGFFLAYMELRNLKSRSYMPDRQWMDDKWLGSQTMNGSFWLSLPFLIIVEAFLFWDTGYRRIDAIFLSVVGVLRLGLLGFADFRPNKDKFLINSGAALIGEKGRIIKAVQFSQPGSVQILNPIFKNDIVDCIADENMAPG